MSPIFSCDKQDCKEPKCVPKWEIDESQNMHIFNFNSQRDGFN